MDHTPRTGNANWQVISQPWNGGSGQLVGGGGDPTGFGTGASRLDKIRMGSGQLPEAQYPAGYLGNYQSKNEGKLKERMDDRSYQRGVHKFVKMTPDEYRWPREFSPDSGLRNQARTARASGNVILTDRFGLAGDPTERYHVGVGANDREMIQLYQKYGVNAVTGQATDTVDPERKTIIARMGPGLSW